MAKTTAEKIGPTTAMQHYNHTTKWLNKTRKK